MIKKSSLLPKLILGIIFGIIIGIIIKQTEAYPAARIFVTFTDLFGNFLTFIIPCLIVAFVAPGIAELGKGVGKLLLITTGIAYLSTVIAGTVSYFVGANVLPLIISKGDVGEKAKIALEPFFSIKMPPLMGVMSALILAFVLGIGMAYIKGNDLLKVTKDFKNIIELVVKNIIIPFVPVYILGVFVKLTVQGEIFGILKSFSSVYVVILLLQVTYIIFQHFIAFLVSGRNPIKVLKNIMPSYMTALGTQSSAATIPINLRCMKKNGVDEEIADFVVPLCATIHLAGDTITLVVSAIGVMLMNGVTPSIETILPFVLMLGITMVAAPGIPGGGVMAALGLIQDMLLFTQPQQAIMIAIHMAQDSFGTATNVAGDGAIAIILDVISKKRKNKSVVEKCDLQVNN